MANTKITELTAVTALAGTDVFPVVDVSASTTNKVSVEDLLRNAPDGTAGAPSIANAGDQDTGIFFPADNSVGVSTDGTQRLVIDSSGQVGIGTTTVNNLNKLHLQAASASLPSTSNQSVLLVENSNNTWITIGSPASNYSGILFADPDDADVGQVRYNHNGNSLEFITNAQERLRIDSSGRVGIGTSSPTCGLDLNTGDGNASIRVRGTADSPLSMDVTDSAQNYVSLSRAGTRVAYYGLGGSGDDFQIVNETSGGAIALSTNSSEKVRIDSSGNIGIGTTSPARPLVVSNAGAEGFEFWPGSGGSGFNTLNHYDRSGLAYVNVRTNADQHIFGRADGEKMRIDSSGNALLGGTTSPASATKSLAIFNGTAPTGSVSNGIVLYAEDVSSSSELKVRDEAGNVTTLSPHNFDLIPEGPSEDMAWSYYSEKDGKRINVDMLKAVRLLEQLTGEQLVFTG